MTGPRLNPNILKSVYKEEPWWKFDIMNKIKGYSERMLHVTT